MSGRLETIQYLPTTGRIRKKTTFWDIWYSLSSETKNCPLKFLKVYTSVFWDVIILLKTTIVYGLLQIKNVGKR